MEINRNNYETSFLLYLDGELNLSEKAAVENFLVENPDLKKEFSLFQKTILNPSPVVFEQKEILYRTEEKRRVIPFYWMRIAAALLVLLFASWFILSEISNKKTPGELASEKIKTESVAQAKSGEIVKQTPVSTGNAAVNPVGVAEIKSGETGNGKQVSPNKKSGVLSENKVKKDDNDISEPVNKNPHPVSNEEHSGDTKLAVLKSSETLGIQPSEESVSKEPKNLAGLQVASLQLSSAAIGDEKNYRMTEREEAENQNAISVFALNDKNKGIGGFLKKITKRAPADESNRKVRVSVFQISY